MQDLPTYYYPLIVFAGIVAGIINTLAGNGSAITLTLLIFLGLPPDVANGTNRIGVVSQSVTAASTFRQAQLQRFFSGSWAIIATTILGAILGAVTATGIDPNILQYIIAALMIFLLLMLIFNPKNRLQRTVSDVRPFTPLRACLFMAIGFYGGFIQMGFGVIFLLTAVLSVGFSLVDANILKLLIVLLYGVPILAIFIWSGDVAWGLGITLGIGQAIGGWVGARYGLRHPKAPIIIRYLLIVMIIAVLIRLVVLP